MRLLMFSLSFSARTGVLISDRKVTKATHLTEKLNLKALALQGGKTLTKLLSEIYSFTGA